MQTLNDEQRIASKHDQQVRDLRANMIGCILEGQGQRMDLQKRIRLVDAPVDDASDELKSPLADEALAVVAARKRG
jgi:hypothetical protein